MMSLKLDEYIKNGWEIARTVSGKGDMQLPFPFIPPSITPDGMHRTLYYWDTYFTNVGLIIDGRVEWARENVDNLIFALNKFGCVPNYTREDGARFCSQPPLLGLMIRDIFAQTKDEKWLDEAVRSLEKEYEFWMTERITPVGLNQYGCNAKNEKDLLEYFDYICTRIKLRQDISVERKMDIAKNFLAEAESGEDYTPRYQDHNALEYAQIDLNSHLYGVEEFLYEYFLDKDLAKAEFYKTRKETRVKLIEKYCYNPKTGIYCDYNFVKQSVNDIISVACFMPYYYGFAKRSGDLLAVYDALKTKGGVASCQDIGKHGYQWGYPFIWAPHQYFAYNALARYGYAEQSERLRVDYINLLSSVFERTGALWERYDENGQAKDLEYPTQKMLGWTAGVYRYLTRRRS